MQDLTSLGPEPVYGPGDGGREDRATTTGARIDDPPGDDPALPATTRPPGDVRPGRTSQDRDPGRSTAVPMRIGRQSEPRRTPPPHPRRRPDHPGPSRTANRTPDPGSSTPGPPCGATPTNYRLQPLPGGDEGPVRLVGLHVVDVPIGGDQILVGAAEHGLRRREELVLGQRPCAWWPPRDGPATRCRRPTTSTTAGRPRRRRWRACASSTTPTTSTGPPSSCRRASTAPCGRGPTTASHRPRRRRDRRPDGPGG